LKPSVNQPRGGERHDMGCAARAGGRAETARRPRDARGRAPRRADAARRQHRGQPVRVRCSTGERSRVRQRLRRRDLAMGSLTHPKSVASVPPSAWATKRAARSVPEPGVDAARRFARDDVEPRATIRQIEGTDTRPADPGRAPRDADRRAVAVAAPDRERAPCRREGSPAGTSSSTVTPARSGRRLGYSRWPRGAMRRAPARMRPATRA